MNTSNPNAKLPQEHLIVVLKMYAEGNTPARIKRYLDDNNIPRPSDKNFYLVFKRKTHIEIIKKFREEYYAKVLDVPIMHKRIRADHLQRCMELLQNTIEKFTDQKTGALKISKEYFNKANEILKRINDLLIAARDEMEKRPGTVVQVFNEEVPLEELISRERDIDEKLLRERAKGISIASFGEGSDKTAETPKDASEPS